MRLGNALHGTEYACAGGEPETAELIGEGGGARKLELRLGDERASVATLAALEQPVPFELAERLPERHPADAEALGEHALRGETIAGRQLSTLDRVFERGLDLRVGRACGPA